MTITNNHASEQLERMRVCVRPVMFATGAKAAPYSIAGTCFWIGYKRSIFVLTAKHVLRDWPPHKLLFYPPGGGKHPLKLLQVWRNIVDVTFEEPSVQDLVVFHAEYTHLPKAIQSKTRILLFDLPGVGSWFEHRHVSSFFLYGYPHSINEADYATSSTRTNQVFLEARYLGQSSEANVHRLSISNPLGIDFNGLSGSPVFSLQHEIAAPASPKFCGLAIMGTASSSIIHFLEATPIFLALDEAAEDIANPGRPKKRGRPVDS